MSPASCKLKCKLKPLHYTLDDTYVRYTKRNSLFVGVEKRDSLRDLDRKHAT